MRSEQEIFARLEIIGALFERARAAAEGADTSTPEGAQVYLLYKELNGALQALNWVAYNTPELEMSVLQKAGHLLRPE